jgi:hypothetical protein
MHTNVIRGQRLTGFGVAPDAESVAIHLMDEESRPATLVLPAECLNALIMTLPEILRRTLHLRFHDESMRLVYPVGHWEVAGSSVQGGVIVTLGTPDGFQVSFSLAALDLLKMATRGASRCMEASGILGN